jgi:hypothetical protein
VLRSSTKLEPFNGYDIGDYVILYFIVFCAQLVGGSSSSIVLSLSRTSSILLGRLVLPKIGLKLIGW